MRMIYKKSYFEYCSGDFNRHAFKLSFTKSSGNRPDLEELESYCLPKQYSLIIRYSMIINTYMYVVHKTSNVDLLCHFP